jgi:hypothetical protein
VASRVTTAMQLPHVMTQTDTHGACEHISCVLSLLVREVDSLVAATRSLCSLPAVAILPLRSAWCRRGRCLFATTGASLWANRFRSTISQSFQMSEQTVANLTSNNWNIPLVNTSLCAHLRLPCTRCCCRVATSHPLVTSLLRTPAIAQHSAAQSESRWVRSKSHAATHTKLEYISVPYMLKR